MGSHVISFTLENVAMGWASFLEDIQRVRDELTHFANRASARSFDPAEFRAEFRSLQELCHRAQLQLDSLLEYATDPTLSLAEEIAGLVAFERREIVDERGGDICEARRVGRLSRCSSDTERKHRGQ